MVSLDRAAGLSPAIIFDLGVIVFVLMIAAQYMKWPFLKFVSLVFFSTCCIAGIGLSLFLFSVGMKAKWTSDGPGMLLIMIMIPGFGFGGLFSGFMALSALSALKVAPRERVEPSPAELATREILKEHLLNRMVQFGKFRIKLSALFFVLGIVIYTIVRVTSLAGGT
ncbi:MAG: hypothetical protein H6624_06110 [Bdellovibrionaceae bacterium]|nr:hypothetical protein [Bdellovibrionales bacterium]MCB9083897.1 hypothetical protein [Pseudobdellovibrionaceae bacterium]